MTGTSRVIRAIAAALLALVLTFASLPAFAVNGSTSMADKGNRYVVNVAGLNLRTGPGMNYGRVASLKRGTVVTYVGNVDGWWKVYTNGGLRGYVDRQYLAPEPTEKTGNYFVTASSLRIRKQPKLSSGVLGTVSKGTVVTITTLNGDWGYLEGGADVQGWVALRYVSKYNTTITADKNTSGTKYYEVAANSLNVRARGTTNSTRIDTIRKGEDVIVGLIDGDWAKIAYKENGRVKYGWVSFYYLQPK